MEVGELPMAREITLILIKSVGYVAPSFQNYAMDSNILHHPTRLDRFGASLATREEIPSLSLKWYFIVPTSMGIHSNQIVAHHFSLRFIELQLIYLQDV